ncbi:MAG: UDP-N-acetylglucosamine 1-carboxyvinyltransferase [Thermoplasmatales archaeon]
MSEVLKISGGRPVSGTIRVGGSKNAALPILAASLAINGTVKLSNVPNITDCHFMVSMLKHLGCEVHWVNKNELEIFSENVSRSDLLVPYVSEVRASSLFLAGLLSRHGEASIGLPGGDRIGNRPLNFHIEGLKRFGYEAVVENGCLRINKRKKTPRRVSVKLPYPSVGATQQILILGSTHNSEVTVTGAATEPEVMQLCEFLSFCGAKISYKNNREFFIKGNDNLRASHSYAISGDRIEFITYMILAALQAELLKIEGAPVTSIKNVIKFLRKIGVKIQEIDTQSVQIQRGKKLKPFTLTAKPYPGFPTDAQPLAAVLTCLTVGTCVIKDTVFPERFRHLEELKRFGLVSELKRNKAVIPGGQKLIGSNAVIQDIRSGAALVLAGLYANGETELHQYHHIRRGYEDFDIKLREIGADLYTVEDIIESL